MSNNTTNINIDELNSKLIYNPIGVATIHTLNSHLCETCMYLRTHGCSRGEICVEGKLYEESIKKEMVNHPGHYQGKNGMEVIDVIEEFTAELSGVEAFDTANMIKYACRWYEKNGAEDLEKIIWYANHLIDHIKNKK